MPKWLYMILENEIVAIFNSYSKRKPGDSSLLGKEDEFLMLSDVVGPYEKINLDGRKLKCISLLIRDENGKPIGLCCINLDVSILNQWHEMIGNFIHSPNLNNSLDPLFKDDWQERINQYIHQYMSSKNLNFPTINREQKKKIIGHLYKVGAFEGKNAANYVAKVLGISRASVYKYLNEE